MKPALSLPLKFLLLTSTVLLVMTLLHTGLSLLRMDATFERQQQLRRNYAEQQFMQQNQIAEQQIRLWLESFVDLIQLNQQHDFVSFGRQLAEQSATMQLHLNIDQLWLHDANQRMLFASQPSPGLFDPLLVQQVLRQQSPASAYLCKDYCVRQLSVPVLNANADIAVISVSTTLVDMLSALHQSLAADLALIRLTATEGGQNRKLLSGSNPRLARQLLQKLPDDVNNLLLHQGVQLEQDGRYYLLSAFMLETKGIYLAVIEDVTDFVQTDQYYRTQLWWSSAALLVAMLLLVYLMMRRISLRLSNLTKSLPLLSQKQYQKFRQQSQNRDGLLTDEVDYLRDAAVDLSVELEQLNQRLEHHNQELEKVAMYDLLTGLPNRNMLQSQLGLLLKQARPQGFICLLFVDLDDFKRINDSLGHALGDDLLKQVAERLKSVQAEPRLLCRFGGDEFVLVQSHCKEADLPFQLASTLLQLLEPPFTLDGRDFVITASIGIALTDDAGSVADDLIRQADIAMYAAKQNGGNGAQAYNLDMYQRVRQRVGLEQDLTLALAQQQFSLSFQPQMEVSSGKLVGFEALIRWKHPERGHVPPDHFIPVLEQNRQIIPLGYWIIERCLQLSLSLQYAGWHDLRIAINLSAEQFSDPELFNRLTALLQQYEVDGRFIELELTERTLVQDIDCMLQRMQQIKTLGVHLAIDDFGTGYSSLNYLKQMPMDSIKIDKSFLSGMLENRADGQIITSIIAMMHQLELQVVAEGVETTQQLEFLRQHGCDMAQGYLIARPIPQTELLGYIEQHFTQGVWHPQQP
ncbi:putative bifunctional diguanylate cyclase/phosphodiesterase [Rheinheimera marina]|uniref:Bifunctional diguanylate cyclase/phosphodiesterase n=1 Tax=Rheinheimera marina TaxID=1774958 RepID=A0ABV9JNY8_9GAMM